MITALARPHAPACCPPNPRSAVRVRPACQWSLGSGSGSLSVPRRWLAGSQPTSIWGTRDEMLNGDDFDDRLHNEIIVDAYGPEEQSLSWYYYLDEHLQFPFAARCVTVRPTSPLKVNERVRVRG